MGTRSHHITGNNKSQFVLHLPRENLISRAYCEMIWICPRAFLISTGAIFLVV